MSVWIALNQQHTICTLKHTRTVVEPKSSGQRNRKEITFGDIDPWKIISEIPLKMNEETPLGSSPGK